MMEGRIAKIQVGPIMTNDSERNTLDDSHDLGRMDINHLSRIKKNGHQEKLHNYKYIVQQGLHSTGQRIQE